MKRKNRGRRPVLSDGDLYGTRAYLFSLFDTHWADLVCALENLDSVDQVPIALRVLSNEDRDYALRILFKAETVEATPRSLRALDRQLKQLDAVIKHVSDSIKENSAQLQALRRMLRSDEKTTRGETAVLVSEKGNIRARVRQD